MNQRILTSIGVATVVAGLAVPGAFAMRNGQDDQGPVSTPSTNLVGSPVVAPDAAPIDAQHAIAQFGVRPASTGPGVSTAGLVTPVLDGRSPDTKDAASAVQYDGYKSSYPQLHALRSAKPSASSTVQIGPVRVPSTWVNVQPSQSLPDGRSPDTKDAAAAARQLAQQSTGDAVSRYLRNTSSPTIPYLSHGIGVDPAQFGGTGVTPALQSSSGGSFSWGDAGIGAGGAFALFLLMTAAAAVSQRNRKHVATS
jgi:hypothetical protein